MKALQDMEGDEFLVAAVKRLEILRAEAKAAVNELIKSEKQAARAGWPEGLAEISKAALAQADAKHRTVSAQIARIEEYVEKNYGISLAKLDATSKTRYQSRFWKEELSPQEVESTGFMEDSLDRGLDTLISKFPRSWVKAQRKKCLEELLRRNTMPFILIGGARHQGIAGAHPLAYYLFLSELFVAKQPQMEIYDAAFGVPLIAALCDRLSGIAQVKGGDKKLLDLFRSPAPEFERRVYELLIAGRAVEKGRQVEFVKPSLETAPDLRIHDFDMPVTLECKFQRRWSKTEEIEIEVLQRIFATLANRFGGKMCALVDLTINKRICDVGAQEITEDVVKQMESLGPFTERQCGWGMFKVNALPPEIEWQTATRLYSPNFLKQVFDWEAETATWDGICAWIKDENNIIAQRVHLPLGMRWRLFHPADEAAKARDVMRHLQEAADQIPVGEAGCLYVGFEDSHRSALADLRTKRIIERLPKFYHRKRGAQIQYLLVDRLYPRCLGDGMPDLVESCIPASLEEDHVWSDLMPTLVFVPEL